MKEIYMKEIYRTYADTEVSELSTRIKCPKCGSEWLEPDMNECGKTYELQCGDEWDLDEGCGEIFKMYFDVD